MPYHGTIPMPDSDTHEAVDAASLEPGVPAAVAETGAYETEEGVVFYDENDPLAWIQTGSAVDLDTME